MTNVDVGIRLKLISNELKTLTAEIREVKKGIGMNDLWDKADMMRNWKVSERTLATWRQDGVIGFVQAGGKIWYPREQRELFLNRNLVNGEE
ncbi:hypothetical protein [Draconibacterium orientale]|uniref:hypothetical protein n=1 Tax=Draconibacterium orientale TaxID=1168034 RepID=UPI0029C07F79|nr:hypothetical protein [Draconibacterium orientale]